MLEEYRREIDDIDRKMLELFEARLDISKKVASYKRDNGLEIFHPDREEAVVDKWRSSVSKVEYVDYAEALIRKILNLSKDLQKECLGQD